MTYRIHDLVSEAAARWPRRAAIEAEDRTWTFAELDDASRRVAATLRKRGVRRSDHVALVARNRADSAALLFACSRIGACLLAVNDRLTKDEVQWIIDDAAPSLAVLDQRFSGVVDASRSIELDGADWWRDDDDDAADNAEFDAPEESGPQDVVLQLYTSGTSGRPKGAGLTHANWAAMINSWTPLMQLDSESRFLQVTPFFHVGGILMILSAIARGTTLVLHPSFDPFDALTCLRNEAITHTLMVPSMIEWVLREPSVDAAPFDALRLMVYGAAPMRVPTLQRASDVFGCRFLQGYGLTESAGVLLALTPDDHESALDAGDDAALASAGRALDCCEVRVVDDKGQDASVGEVVARGSNMFTGYHGDEPVDYSRGSDSWFATGDIGAIDQRGYIRIVDRKKDMILVGGENVYPVEVERVLATHESIVDAAVVGLPHDVWGEVPVAVIVTKDAVELETRSLLRWCRTKLAHFKCPTKVVFVDALPRNAAGKLLKEEIRKSLSL